MTAKNEACKRAFVRAGCWTEAKLCDAKHFKRSWPCASTRRVALIPHMPRQPPNGWPMLSCRTSSRTCPPRQTRRWLRTMHGR